jgi:ATP-dependent protease ClpP protease subunit
MKHIFFQGIIDEKSIEAFANKLDAIPETESVKVFFSSPGGSFPDAITLAELWSARKVHVICDHEASSAAFTAVCLATHARREMRPNAFSRLHLISRSVETREMLRAESFDRFLAQNTEHCNQWYLEQVIPHLNAKQAHDLLGGGEVFLDSVQAQKIIDVGFSLYPFFVTQEK